MLLPNSPNPPTPPMPEPLKPDAETLGYVGHIKDEQEKAYEKARQIHANKDLNEAAKRRQTDEHFSAITAEIEQYGETMAYVPEEDVKKTTAAALPRFAEDPAEANAYLATRGKVEAAASSMDLSAFTKWWEERLTVAAVEPKERLTLRIIMDTLPKLRGRDGANGKKQMLFADTIPVKKLAEITADFLMSDEQRTAKKKLDQWAANKRGIEAAKFQAVNAMKPGWSVDRDGNIVDSDRTAMRRQIQARA